MPDAFGELPLGVTLRLFLPCDLGEVRATAGAVRSFLEEQGLHEDEMVACDLALTEACNNAVEFAAAPRRAEPVQVRVTCHPSIVEFQITDHTSGFVLPKTAALPDPSAERGRGLFIIRSLMDEVDYIRGDSENTLSMRKRRTYQAHRVLPPAAVSPKEARIRLAECQETLRNMARELCLRSETLSAIFRCTTELGRTENLEEFSLRLLNDLVLITGAEWFVLRLAPPGGEKLELFATSECDVRLEPQALRPDSGSSSIETRAAQTGEDVWFEAQQVFDWPDPIPRLKPDSFGLVHPFFFGDTLIGTLAIGRQNPQSPFSLEQVEVIHTFAEFLAIQVVNTRLQDERLHLRLVSRELEIARDIQRALLPKSLPQAPGYGLAAYYESAREVGGDFYDAHSVSATRQWLVIADVMGKGVPAALFAAILRNLVPAILQWVRRPSDLLRHLNRQLFEELSRVNMFITAQMVLLNLEERKLTAASAGHCPVLLASKIQPRASAILTEGMPLGVVRDASFHDVTVGLGSGCRVLLYTDGLTEAANPQGVLFGQQRLMSWLSQTTGRPATAQSLKDELVGELGRFQAGAKLQDDQTFLILAEEQSV